MPAHGGLAHREPTGHVTERPRAPSQQVHDGPAGGVSQAGEGAVHRSSLARHVGYVVNHIVNYMQVTSFVNPTHTER